MKNKNADQRYIASVGRARARDEVELKNKNAEVAQLVEHIPEEDGVASSSLALGTRI